MKIFYQSIIAFILVLVMFSCGGTGKTKDSSTATDTTATKDTGYTGIKQFTTGNYIVSEVNFKNGIRQGVTKTFYKSGRLQRTYWYENGLKQDSSCWYYEEGQVFRVTPFVNDTVDGIMKQYYRTGQLKAKMGYSKGLRTTLFQEFTRDGKLVKDYPEIMYTVKDDYKSKGKYGITLTLNKKTEVRFCRGEFTNGIYDTARIRKIKTDYNIGHLELKKTGSPKKSYVSIIGEVLTDFGNRILIVKKIELPYNDLD